MALTAHDIAGFTGKEIEVWVKVPTATAPNVADVDKVQVRGIQNFNPGQEKAETKVSELGYESTKTIYGTSTYNVSTSMLVRDLVAVGQLGGINTTTGRRVIVSDFSPINCINWIKNPDNAAEIYATVITTGFKPRTCSDSFAVEANATVTLDGAADMVVMVDGKADVREHQGDGSCHYFATAAGVTTDYIYSVEYPAGQPLVLYTGYTFIADAGGGVPGINFTTAPTDNAKVRIVYKIS